MGMSLGQFLMVGIAGAELSADERNLFKKNQPGGYILFSRNVVSARQVRALTDELNKISDELPLIAIDQEGGRVWRTRDFSAGPPDAATFAERGNFHQISQFGALTGRFLELLGINFNLAPVLDLDHFPDLKNGLRGRCWGRDSQDVIDRAGLFNRWMRKNGVLGCGKHFPGNGRALADTHHELPVADCSLAELLREDLLPYTALAPELDGILASHLDFLQLDSGVPASLSRRILTGLLRDQLGYEGLILTDDLDMGAIAKNYGRGADVRQAVEAGADLALICHQTETLPEALKALEGVSDHLVYDTEKRLKKARKRLGKQPLFTEAAWEKVNEDLRVLTKEVTGSDRFSVEGEAHSPVEEF